MLLAIDVGNTQTHLGVFQGENLLEDWRVVTVRESTSDELAVLIHDLLQLNDLATEDIDAMIVSSVVPHYVPEYRRMSERYLEDKAMFVGPGIKTGMPILIDNPLELGADRLVNAVAGYERFKCACVVVDFGTAINYDAVSAEGEYLGGIIAPGIEISMEALTERAAKLPEIDLAEPEHLIGKSTAASIQSGIVHGFAAQIDGIVRRLRDELGENTKVIATGGLAGSIAPFTESIDEVDDLLTLEGLRIIYERNA